MRLLRCSVLAGASGLLLAASTAAGSVDLDSAQTFRSTGGPTATFASMQYGVRIQAVYDQAGNPVLVANFTPDGGLTKPRWAICPPSNVNTCTPTNSRTELQPGAAPAGTVFEATAAYQGQNYVARSAPWQGTIRATAAPRLEGHPAVGATLTPRAGSWVGGWGSEYDALRVQACRTTRATGCVTLSAGEAPGSANPTIVGGWLTGWYLFTLDARTAHDAIFAKVAYRFAADVPPWTQSQTVSRSAPLGPVTGPPPPRVSILRNALIRRGRLLVAHVHCTHRCELSVTVEDNSALSEAHVTIKGSALIGVPRGQLHHGLLQIRIHVDSSPAVTGKTQLH